MAVALARLEEEKVAAVASEDYSKAADIKSQIDAIHRQIKVALNLGGASGGGAGGAAAGGAGGGVAKGSSRAQAPQATPQVQVQAPHADGALSESTYSALNVSSGARTAAPNAVNKDGLAAPGRKRRSRKSLEIGRRAF